MLATLERLCIFSFFMGPIISQKVWNNTSTVAQPYKNVINIYYVAYIVFALVIRYLICYSIFYVK